MSDKYQNVFKDTRITIPIHDRSLLKEPRIFDVIVDTQGMILGYTLQNVKDRHRIDSKEVNRQIHEYLANMNH